MGMVAAHCSLLLHDGEDGVCVRCGKALTGRQKKWCGHGCEDKWWEQHYWPIARKAARKRDGYRCVRCGSTENLTVDHVIPLMGRGYRSGCVHHLSNLQTLCHGCHVAKTSDDMAYARSLSCGTAVTGRAPNYLRKRRKNSRL